MFDCMFTISHLSLCFVYRIAVWAFNPFVLDSLYPSITDLQIYVFLYQPYQQEPYILYDFFT